MHLTTRTSATTAASARGLSLRVQSLPGHCADVAGRAKGLLAAALLSAATASGAFTNSTLLDERPSAAATSGVVALSALPPQGQAVYQRILAGGPFRYGKDGSVFGNRERKLPRQDRGYYREYTVPTPGSRDRGARRIVCGGEILKSPETCFYTKDHYQSFQKIESQR
jgi:ribonuclease T1